jgi:hypothetical protein
MEQAQAVFYRGNYFLLPEHTDFYEFCAHNTEKDVTLTQLTEHKCMAPYFIYESEKVVTVRFEKDECFAVTVYRMDKAEYDARLWDAVQVHCPGCARYTDDGGPGDLEGHHEEISLDSVCFEREEKDERPEFTVFMRYFWQRFFQARATIKKRIDAGQTDKLFDFFDDLFTYFMPPVRLFFQKKDGVYHLYATAANNRLHWAILRMLGSLMPESLKRDFAFHPALTKDGMHYAAQSDLMLPADLTFSVEPHRGGYAVTAHASRYREENESAEIFLIYLYLCERLGENELLFLCERLLLSSSADASVKTPNELVALFEKTLADESGFLSDRGGAGPFNMFETDWTLPYKDAPAVVSTRLFEVSAAMYTDYEHVLALRARYHIDIGYLSFSVDQNSVGQDGRFAAVTYFFEALRENGIAQAVANVASENRTCVDYVVFDRKLFKKALRDNAPLLQYFDTKWVECTPDGFRVWQLGYTPEPVETVPVELECVEN